MKKREFFPQKGFTLIELLMYLAIFSVVLALLMGFLWNIIFGSVKETAYQELQQNGRFVFFKMTQEIRRAKSISSPLVGSSANFLSLEMVDPNLNPTTFDIDNGKLRITQGGNPSQYLTTDKTVIASLQFKNFSYPNGKETIKTEMEIHYLNPQNRPERQAIVNLGTTVSLPSMGVNP